jgi:hypothetical protein
MEVHGKSMEFINSMEVHGKSTEVHGVYKFHKIPWRSMEIP